jgi:hypothetical protein
MSRAIITHFDGDPFTLNAWLTLYEKYWRGECDTVYVTLYYNPKVVPSDVIDFNKRLLNDYPEIKASIIGEHHPPEKGNQDSLTIAKEDYIGLIESDGLIYSKGVVDQCFRLLEKEGQDVVAPPWELIKDSYMNGDLHSKGFMRCFTFAKKSIWDKTDHDFMPRSIPANTRITEDYCTERNIDLDCFGWISWQMLLLTNKITYTPSNVLGPDVIFNPYSNFKWVHIRQMSSSAIGMGGGEFGIWTGDDDVKLLDKVMRLFNEDFPNGPAEFTHIKAVAFKLLFYDMLISKQTIDELPESMTNDPKKMNRNSFVQLDNGLFFVTWGNVKQRTGMIDNIKEALQISGLKYEVIVN